MDAMQLEDAFKHFDRRFDRIEQFLPTLATREELGGAVSTLRTELATKVELAEAVATLRAEMATKTELAEAMAMLRAELASKAELAEAVATLRGEIRTESADTRRYMKVLVEDLSGEIRLLAEGLVALNDRDARQHAECLDAHAVLERRIIALEPRPPRRRSR